MIITDVPTTLDWLGRVQTDPNGNRPALAGVWVVKVGTTLVAVTCDPYHAHVNWTSAKSIAHSEHAQRFAAGVYGVHRYADVREAMKNEAGRWAGNFQKMLARLAPKAGNCAFQVYAASLRSAVAELAKIGGDAPDVTYIRMELDADAQLLTLSVHGGDLFAQRGVDATAIAPGATFDGLYNAGYLLDGLALFDRNDTISIFVAAPDKKGNRMIGIGWWGYALACIMPLDVGSGR